MTIAFGLPSRRPSARHASPAAPDSRACMGEPWEMKTLGSRWLMSGRLLQQAFELQRFLHLRPGADARLERREIRPAVEVDALEFRPVEEHEQIGVGDAECLARQVVLASKLLVQPVEARGEVFLRDR